MSTDIFRNPRKSIEERIEAILPLLTLEEKCSLLRYDAPAIERLGIPAYNWWSEALHGVGRAGKATVFPQAIGMAATFNPSLIEQVAGAISDEARAKHHAAVREGSRQQYQGLTFWSPNINIFRDPRWGRGQETWGEDPFLTGEMGAAFVRGLQGNDSNYLKAAACAKHYAVHSGPEKDRHRFDARPSLKDFEETYLPAFKRLVEEGVEAVMGAYNRVYGEPCCGSDLLIQKILRGRWGFQGHFVSDCGAIRDFHNHHGVTSTAEESAALALKSGCDLNCGSVYCSALLDAVTMGLCSESDVDKALTRLFRTQIRLGIFDPEEAVPFASIPLDIVNCEAHREMSLKTATESLVLLKNRNHALPLRSEDRYILVVGPHAASVEALLGNYFGLGTRMTTVLEGMALTAPTGVRLDFRKGCLVDQPKANEIDWSIFEAGSADVVVAAMGIDANCEGEEGDAILSAHFGDRMDCQLPENQVEYIRKIAERIAERGTKTRLVVLLFGGSHLSVPEVHEYADALLQVWYPGEAGGEAIARVLFGESGPGGRMPLTVPFSIEDLPAYDNYAMAGRTYRFMEEGRMLYPFGFGLSYTTFAYGLIELASSEVPSGSPCLLSVKVSNTGDYPGHEVVQCYLQRKDRDPEDPRFSLVAFIKVYLLPGESRVVNLAISSEAFTRYTADGDCVAVLGEYEVVVGGSLPVGRSRELGAASPSEATVTIV